MPYKDPVKQKEAQRASWLRNHDANKDRIKINNNSRRGRWRLLMRELKMGRKCQSCGEDHPACLHFHHRNPSEKEFGISRGITLWSKKKILAEIEKCDVLCANCHAKLHDL